MVKSLLNYFSKESDSMTIEYDNPMTILKEVVKLGGNLPNYVFHDEFESYLFFDNDICTSENLISVTKIIVRLSYGSDVIAKVFTSSDYKFLGDLYMNEDWVTKIASLSTEMNNAGDYGSLIILDQNKQWAIFQKTPVDEGVMGFNRNLSLESINELIYENFVDCDVFKEWLEEKTSHNVELVKLIGRSFLTRIIENYKAE